MFEYDIDFKVNTRYTERNVRVRTENKSNTYYLKNVYKDYMSSQI